jgi:hypothetical protein
LALFPAQLDVSLSAPSFVSVPVAISLAMVNVPSRLKIGCANITALPEMEISSGAHMKPFPHFNFSHTIVPR